MAAKGDEDAEKSSVLVVEVESEQKLKSLVYAQLLTVGSSLQCIRHCGVFIL